MQYVTRADQRGIELRGASAVPHPTGIVGGLIALQSNTVPRILTGIEAGPVRITVNRVDARPAEVAEGWEDVVEISCSPDEHVVVAAGPYVDGPGALFALNPPDEEWFRLRVHARHRDAQFDLVATEPLEEYLLQSWPEASGSPTTLVTTSGVSQRLARSERAASPAVVIQRPRPEPSERREILAELSCEATAHGVSGGGFEATR